MIILIIFIYVFSRPSVHCAITEENEIPEIFTFEKLEPDNFQDKKMYDFNIVYILYI